MAGQDDLIRIVMDVVGQEKVAQAQRAIEQEEEAIRKLASQLKATTITQAQFDAASLQSAANIKQSMATVKAAGSGGVNPQALLEFSRAAEDAQYGISGVLNNIPGLIAALGGGAGIAGAASLAAVAIYQLYKNWGSIRDAFTGGDTRTAAQQLEELAKVVHKTADEYERLARAARGDAGIAKIADARPEVEGKRDAAALKAIAEAGGFMPLRAGIRNADPGAVAAQPGVVEAKAQYDKLLKQQQEIIEVWGKSGTGYDLTNIDAELAKARAEIDRQNDLAADRIGEAAINARDNPAGLDNLRDIVGKNPDAFGAGGRQLVADLDAAADQKSPAQIEEEKEEDFATQRDAEETERQNKIKYEEWKKEDEERVKEEEFAAKRDAEDRERLNKIKFDAWQKDEEEDRKAQELYDKERQEGAQRLADWQFQEGQKLADEDQAAQLQDAMSFEQRRKDDRKRTATVLDGSASLRDSIQQSLAIDNSKGEKTATESLAELREMKGFIKRMAERKIDMTARAG